MPAEFAPDVPADYAATLEFIAPTITDKMERNAVVGEDWISNVSRLMTALAMTEQQRQLLAVQVERARQGLPPLDVSNYSAGANVNVGVSSDTKDLLTWLAIGFGALWLFNQHA